ncbi:hypothetical protein niasHT_029365 [Heterodera trifolii]|uniref:OTU domain-containing protein n=1 Tax=Heterodera trifolii TaxID=157864 RepID=A0ABD2J9U0_9BILA
MYIATSQSCNGISGEPSSSSPPVNWRSGALRGGRKVTKEPAYAFILPNLEQYPVDFRHFLERDIIEISTLRRLENSGHFNWWCHHDSNHRLPLAMTGDGKCLLHTASLDMARLYLSDYKCSVLAGLMSGPQIRAEKDKEHKPGLGYLDRWETREKVPAALEDAIRNSLDSGEFETQEQVEKMLKEDKRFMMRCLEQVPPCGGEAAEGTGGGTACVNPLCGHMTVHDLKKICKRQIKHLEMGKLEVPNLIGRTKSIGNITLRQFADRIFEVWSEEELLVTDANRKCNPLELLHLLSGIGLGQHEQGIRSPIMARVDYGAANDKEHKPGLNYLDRWEIKGKVPAKWVQCLHESMQKGEFETQEEVEKMLEEFKEEEGAPMAEMVFKETDGVVDKRMAAVIKAAGKRECGDNYWVMEPADYFVAGVRKLVVVAGDKIRANGTSIRDKMAHFLLPDDTHWGDEAGPEMKGKDGLGKRIKKLMDRYAKGLDAVAESYGKLESAWPPSEKEYQDLATKYSAVISRGRQLIEASWPTTTDRAKETEKVAKRMEQRNFEFAEFLDKALEHDENLQLMIDQGPGEQRQQPKQRDGQQQQEGEQQGKKKEVTRKMTADEVLRKKGTKKIEKVVRLEKELEELKRGRRFVQKPEGQEKILENSIKGLVLTPDQMKAVFEEQRQRRARERFEEKDQQWQTEMSRRVPFFLGLGLSEGESSSGSVGLEAGGGWTRKHQG